LLTHPPRFQIQFFFLVPSPFFLPPLLQHDDPVGQSRALTSLGNLHRLRGKFQEVGNAAEWPALLCTFCCSSPPLRPRPLTMFSCRPLAAICETWK
jgi:hypothetical protein